MSRTVIVFMEDCILAATGREGAYPVLSGVKKIGLKLQGDSFERWGEALKELPGEWRSGPVRLVLPAGICSYRVLKLPFARGKQLADMALREMADSFRNEVSDYSVLSAAPESGADICAGGADAEQLERICSVLRDAGISVGSVSIPMEGYLRMLQRMDRRQDGTAIYLFFEEGSMTSVLCQNGRYLYSGRSRLFSEPGTLDFGTEIVRSISGILQFYASEKRELPITDVYYAGCPAEDFSVSVEGIENMNLKATPLKMDQRMTVPSGETAPDWIPCMGALVKNSRSEKRIDLYQAGKKLLEKEEKPLGIGRHLLVPAAVFLLCMLPAAVFWVMNGVLLHEIGQKQEWIDSGEVQEQYQQALSLEQRLSDVESSIAAAELTGENLSVYPKLSNEILHQIRNAGGIGIQCRITGYDASTGILVFQAGSREVIDVPDYIQKLKNSGLFHTVNYTGYDYENEWYSLSLSCVMAGRISGKAQEQGITWETVRASEAAENQTEQGEDGGQAEAGSQGEEAPEDGLYEEGGTQ